MKVTTPALSLSIALVDTSHFELGRYVRINAGHPTEEDARIVGFGRRLTAATRWRHRHWSWTAARDCGQGTRTVSAAGRRSAECTTCMLDNSWTLERS